jgi:hypothetical protein
MGCPSEVVIGDNLVFSICTHDPDTGVLTDAESAPTYRIYEDETGTAILSGTMAKLDDANTTVFYTESIACTAGNGFEEGKTYTVYIEATVDGDTGGICYGFKAVTKTGYALTASERNSIADAILVRAASNIENSADRHSLGAFVMLATNASLSGTTLTAKKPSDDSTFDTYTVTTDADADPITGVS